MRFEWAANFFFIAKSARSFYKRRPIRGILWGGLAAFMSKNLNKGMMAFSTIIKGIYLHDNGINVDITFQDASFKTVDIRQI